MKAWERGYTLLSFNVPESETKSCKISQSVPHSLGLGLACVIMGITSYLATNYYHHGGGGGRHFFNNRNVIFFPVSGQCLQYYNTAMKFIM